MDDIMMKYAEAIQVRRNEALEKAICVEIKEYIGENGINTIVELNPKTIVRAIEKQIPRKPEFWGDGYANGAIALDYAKCPNCGNDNFEYEIGNWGCKYCPDCGQALDWSDTQ